jgi:hypothetical protein
MVGAPPGKPSQMPTDAMPRKRLTTGGNLRVIATVVLATVALACASPRPGGWPTDGGGGNGGTGGAGGTGGIGGTGGPAVSGNGPDVVSPPADASSQTGGRGGTGSMNPGRPDSSAAPGPDAGSNGGLPHRLQVTIEGGGRVEADDGSISCPGRCIAEFAEPRRVIMSVKEDGDFAFAGWGGTCPTGPTCSVQVTGNVPMAVTFAPLVTWRQRLEGGRALGLAVAGDDLFVVGHFEQSIMLGGRPTNSTGDHDAFVARFDVTGKLHWLKTFGGAGYDSAEAVTVVGDQIVVTGGLTGSLLDASGTVVPASPNTDQGFTAWYSRDGELRRVLPLRGSAIASDGQGNVAVGSIPVTVFSSTGVKRWEANERFNNLLVTNLAYDRSSNLIATTWMVDPVTVAGRTHTSAGGNDVLFVKFTANGAVAWSVRFGKEMDDNASGLVADAAGDVYAAGISFQPGSQLNDVFMLSLSGRDGAERWSRRYERVTGGTAGGVVIDEAGNIYLSGRLSDGDIGGGVRSPGGNALFRFDTRTGAARAAKSLAVALPYLLARHGSADLIGAHFDLYRFYGRW